ncbi:MFS transporter [Sphingomonas naphthae]|uniref:MFS transporter n=1 Tax=Sphingomonas naphthae TaxID=1813468 RepID=A0ABY7TKM6_9SPHN|nr:MFS transporter [Sphingomonas naphthae]WCT73788.1 MFS transporter [Sphingomonas naphthae]
MESIEKSAMRKILLRVVVVMGIFYITNLLDRLNVGYAALAMNDDLGLSPKQFGFGAGIFFVGYLMAEIPSNLLMLRFGSRLWIARIMISWGVISGATAFVSDPVSFYIVRFLLGLAEAGFLPGAMLYLATWVPARHRSKAVLLFFALGQFAGLGGPLVSAWILGGNGFAGLANWQALFVIEAVPTIVLGVAALWLLAETPRDARWLTEDERVWLEGELATDSRRVAAHGLHGLWDGVRDWKVWALFLSKFANGLAVFTVALWLPQIASENTGLSVRAVGWVVAAPALIVIPSMWFIGNWSDRSGNRTIHTALALGLCALFAGGAALHASPIVSLALICGAAITATVATGISWAIAPTFLRGKAAAGGFAIVNAGGITAGFVGGSVVGWLRQETGAYDAGLYLVAGACVIGALAVLSLTRAAADGSQGPAKP